MSFTVGKIFDHPHVKKKVIRLTLKVGENIRYRVFHFSSMTSILEISFLVIHPCFHLLLSSSMITDKRLLVVSERVFRHPSLTHFSLHK